VSGCIIEVITLNTPARSPILPLVRGVCHGNAAAALVCVCANWMAVAEPIACATEPSELHVPTIAIIYPFTHAVFPRDMVAPEILWNDPSSARHWRVTFHFPDRGAPWTVQSDGQREAPVIDPRCLREDHAPELPTPFAHARGWRPSEDLWEQAKSRAVRQTLTIEVEGFAEDGGPPISRGAVSVRVSQDPVAAPLFYRDVPLMPARTREGIIQPIAHNALPLIEWRVRRVDQRQSRVVLRDMPTCVNCHSFSARNPHLAMDIDGPDGDKGAHAIARLAATVRVERAHVRSWNSVAQREGRPRDSYGLFPQVSPDGRYVIASIREELYVQNYTDWRFLQTFYPTRGILAVLDVGTGEIHSLPGADDPNYVHTNPTWSPDGQWIVYARAPARQAYSGGPPARFANDPNETQIRYDLYRIPFNAGRGGVAKPLRGASNNGRSNSFPKFSPDGRWIVFVQAANGLLLRPDSELWIVPAEGGQARRMNCNLSPMNSWHSWSPNGRWLAFVSKALGGYTRLFLTHVDPDGTDAPPVLVPDCTAANRAVNLPEFLPAGIDELQLIEVPAVDYRKLMEQAIAAVGTGEVERALQLAKEALALKDDLADVHVLYGYVLDALGRAEEADTSFQRALALAPGHPRAHRFQAMALLRRQQVAEAVRHLQHALAVDPNDDDSYRLMGDALSARGQSGSAERFYRQAIELNPHNAEALNNLARLVAARGELREALGYLEQALQHRPTMASALANYGVILSRLGHEAEAARRLRQAVQADPNQALAQAALAMLLATAQDSTVRDPAEAIVHAQAALELSGRRSTQAWVALAAAYAAHKDFERAAQTAQEAERLISPDSPLWTILQEQIWPAIRHSRSRGPSQ